MNKIIEFLIGDTVREILQEAMRKDRLEDYLTNEGSTVLNHVIKLLKWKDPLDYNKHINEMDGKLRVIQSKKLKNNNKFLKADQAYKWLFEDNGYNDDNVVKNFNKHNCINALDFQYGTLPELRTNEEVFVILDKILPQICNDLYLQKFISLRQYLPQDI